MTGTFGGRGCFPFYLSKNHGVIGDGGTIIHYLNSTHLSEAYQHLETRKGSRPVTGWYAETVLLISLYNSMAEYEQEYVTRRLTNIFNGRYRKGD